MALSFIYLMARRLVGMLPGSLRSEHAKDVEIAVLRHQLSVLRRQVQRAEFRPADRALLALLSRALPRELWSVFLVTPARSYGGTDAWSPANGPTPPLEVAAHRSPTIWSR
jgi:putative transposase